MMKSRNLVLMTAFTMLFSTCSLAESTPAQDPIVAKYSNGQVLHKSEVEAKVRSSLGGELPEGKKSFDDLPLGMQRQLIQGIATQHVLKQAMEKSPITQTNSYKQMLAASQETASIGFFLQQVAQKQLTEKKVSKAYSELVKELKDNNELKLSHIVVKDKAAADTILASIKSGKISFEQAAKESSIDQNSSATGGTLGYFSREQMPTEFSKVAYGVKQGTISAPVQTDFGWHLIKVDDIRKRKIPTLEEIKPQLEQSVLVTLKQEYINDTIKNAKVELVQDKQ